MAKSRTATLDVDEGKKTTLRIPTQLYKQLGHARVEEDRPQQEIVADALEMYFDSRKKSTRRKTTG